MTRGIGPNLTNGACKRAHVLWTLTWAAGLWPCSALVEALLFSLDVSTHTCAGVSVVHVRSSRTRGFVKIWTITTTFNMFHDTHPCTFFLTFSSWYTTSEINIMNYVFTWHLIWPDGWFVTNNLLCQHNRNEFLFCLGRNTFWNNEIVKNIECSHLKIHLHTLTVPVTRASAL